MQTGRPLGDSILADWPESWSAEAKPRPGFPGLRFTGSCTRAPGRKSLSPWGRGVRLPRRLSSPLLAARPEPGLLSGLQVSASEQPVTSRPLGPGGQARTPVILDLRRRGGFPRGSVGAAAGSLAAWARMSPRVSQCTLYCFSPRGIPKCMSFGHPGPSSAACRSPQQLTL